jgi:hypothetical protein
LLAAFLSFNWHIYQKFNNMGLGSTAIDEAVGLGGMAIYEAMGLDGMAIDEAVGLEWSMAIVLEVVQGQTRRIRTASADWSGSPTTPRWTGLTFVGIWTEVAT